LARRTLVVKQKLMCIRPEGLEVKLDIECDSDLSVIINQTADKNVFEKRSF